LPQIVLVRAVELQGGVLATRGLVELYVIALGVLERIRSRGNLPHYTLTVGRDRDRTLLSAAFGA